MNVHQAYILWFVQYHFVQELDHILGQYTNYFEDPHPYVLRLINDKQDTLRMRHGENEEKKLPLLFQETNFSGGPSH